MAGRSLFNGLDISGSDDGSVIKLATDLQTVTNRLNSLASDTTISNSLVVQNYARVGSGSGGNVTMSGGTLVANVLRGTLDANSITGVLSPSQLPVDITEGGIFQRSNDIHIMTGNLVIGRDLVGSPLAPLHISSSKSLSAITDLGVAYFSTNDDKDSVVSGMAHATDVLAAVSVYAEGSILASSYTSVSDQRTKHDISYSRPCDLLDVALQLRPCKYQYIDIIRHGSHHRLGFIANQVETTLREAVPPGISQFVPSIYRHAICDAHGNIVLCEGDARSATMPLPGHRIRLFYMGRSIDATVKAVSDTSFTIAENHSLRGPLFVYGVEEKSILSLDHSAISTVSIGAIQQLYGAIQQLSAEVTELRKRLDDLPPS